MAGQDVRRYVGTVVSAPLELRLFRCAHQALETQIESVTYIENDNDNDNGNGNGKALQSSKIRIPLFLIVALSWSIF